MAILLSKNIAQCDDRAERRPRGATTARCDDRAAVGWAWTGRNLILDEALIIPATKEYLADIVLLTMYNVDNMDLLSITPILHRTLHFAESCQRIEIV